MSGYTPVFASVATGSLYGQWPDIGVFLLSLALADKHGVVDVAFPVLAGILGLPVEDVKACMRRLCEPDPASRSRTEEGRRLVLLDPDARDWGWRIVNHALYREKARKAAYDARRTESGEDAERKRKGRRKTRAVPTRPDASRDVPLSNTNANTNTNGEKSPPGPPSGGDPPAGLDMDAWNRWVGYRREIRKPLRPASIPAAQKALTAFGSDQGAVVEQSIASGWTGLFPLKNAAPSRSAAEPVRTWRPTEDDEGGFFS